MKLSHVLENGVVRQMLHAFLKENSSFHWCRVSFLGGFVFVSGGVEDGMMAPEMSTSRSPGPVTGAPPMPEGMLPAWWS